MPRKRKQKPAGEPDPASPSTYPPVFQSAVEGTVMGPQYPHDSVVTFDQREVWRDGVVDGKCYFLLLADGTRVMRFLYRTTDLDTFTARIAETKWQTTIHRKDVVMMARAMFTTIPDGWVPPVPDEPPRHQPQRGFPSDFDPPAGNDRRI